MNKTNKHLYTLCISSLLLSSATLYAAPGKNTPEQYASFALAQENATLYVNDTTFHRLFETDQSCTPPHLGHDRRVFWISPFGALTFQDNEGHHPGYTAGTGGITAGVDYQLFPTIIMGGAVGYSGIGFSWKESLGHSNIQNGYGSLYGSYVDTHGFLFGSVVGSYNHYSAHRNIKIGDAPSIMRFKAKSQHSGYQTSAHLKGGLLYTVKSALISPFATLEYLYVHESGFKEHGADGLDFHVHRKKSDLLEGEAGVSISRCFSMCKNHFSPLLALSVIREWRFRGEVYKASLADSTTVEHFHGMNPTETLFGGILGFILLLPDEHRTLSFSYQGKWGKDSQDNNVIAQFITHF